MAISDLWDELKRKTVAGDLGDRIRSLPLVQRFRYLHTQPTPVISFELLPKLKASRQDWLASTPKAESGPTPGLLLFRLRSRLGLTDVISLAEPRTPSRAKTGIERPKRRVKVL